MTETEKLRALLAEARVITQDSLDSNTTGFEAENEVCKCNACERYRSIIARIDAALAEPVDDYDIDADLRMHKEDRLRLRVENLRLTKERDEARAEVAAAYQRGAEAMREAALREVLDEKANLDRGEIEDAIRALPAPKST